MCACMYVHTCLCVYLCACVYMCVCVHVSVCFMYVCVFISCMCVLHRYHHNAYFVQQAGVVIRNMQKSMESDFVKYMEMVFSNQESEWM